MMAPQQTFDMTLARLLAGIVPVPAALERRLTDLTLDSREAGPGSCFVALGGTREHGLRHVDDALARGAVAVLCEDACPVGIRAAVLQVPGLRGLLGTLATRFFNAPALALDVFAITGTNGKTTVAHLLAQASTLLARGCGYIGTLGAGLGDVLTPTANTTPDIITLNRWLARFRDAGCVAAALEASSHALAQDRLAGLPLRAAAFTNLGHDHLDYHATLADYAAAKRRLFERDQLGAAVINIDDACGRAFAATLRNDVALWTLSSRDSLALDGQPARLRARDIVTRADGSAFTLVLGTHSASVTSPLAGRFNIDNLLCIAGLLLAAGQRFDDVVAVLPRLVAVPGRLQGCGRTAAGGQVIVDYAHSPDSLAAVLSSLRALAPRRLLVVFGCGGERDRSKRPLMGRVAEEGADMVVVTSDNPRSEAMADIAADIVAGMRAAPAAVMHDRREAIAAALALAGAGDIVLIAGKGHEATQEVAGVFSPFSDAAVVAELLAEAAP